MPARDARRLFAKCSPFQLAESSFKKIAEHLGPGLEEHLDEFLETIRRSEILPQAETKVVAASMDVLLQKPGKKKGRKRQRPGERKHETEGTFDSPTSYRNAVVGSVTLYGDVPPDEKTPERLQSRYVARMPEDQSLTLKMQLQHKVESTLSRLPPDVVKIFLSDATQGIRKETDTNPLFAGFEKIIDFFHACDHLSNAAEAIFGKKSCLAGVPASRKAMSGMSRNGGCCWKRTMVRNLFGGRCRTFSGATNTRRNARMHCNAR